MRWHSVILIAGVFLVVESAKSRFHSVEDEEEREDSGHMFDVKKIVKGTIDAIGGQGTTPKPDGLYQLLQIPSEIISQIASDAGYIEPTTTITPKRRKKRRNHKTKKYRKISEDGSYEGTYVRVDDDDEDSEDEDAYKPRKKNKSKRRHHRPIYLPPNYVPPPMVSSPPLRQSLPLNQIITQAPTARALQRQQVPQSDPLTSIFAPLSNFQMPSVPLPTFAPITIPTTTTTTPSPPTMAPLSIRPVEKAVSPLADTPAAIPQYAYVPEIQPDGKTYYKQVLVLSPIKAGEALPETIQPTTPAPTTTTQAPTTTANSLFVTEGPTTSTEEPSTTETHKRKTKIRRRLIKNIKIETPQAAVAIQQLPQSEPMVVSTTTMRPVAITFSPNLELFQPTAPSEEISLQEQKEIKIKPRTHGTRTHSVGKAIESGSAPTEEVTNKPTLIYVTEVESSSSSEETTSPSIPTPPVPNFTPKLITTQMPSIEEQMKNNEVFSVSLETGKKGGGTISVPQVTALHSIANRRLQAEEDYLPPIEEKKRGKKKGRKGKKERKEERVKKVESNEVEDIKEAVEAVRREKKEKVQRRFHQEEEQRDEEKKENEKEEEEEENVTTTEKPRRRHHKKKSHSVIEVETPKKISLVSPEEDTESPVPSASPPSSSFRRSLAPALIDVRELNGIARSTNSPSIRHVHHAERLAILRKSLEARARGVKQLSTQDKEEDDEKREVQSEGEESKPLTDLSELFPSTTTEIARKKKTRRHRKRKTTVAPTTTTTTTTEPSTTPEDLDESYELNDEDYEENEKDDISFEVDEDGDKVVKKKTKRTTTTETPSTTTTESPKKLKVLRPHCLNIRSFARQFGMVDVFDFVEEHCSFIENYYPSLTCERREEYLAYCAGVWDSTKL